jgi:hypothetical protein
LPLVWSVGMPSPDRFHYTFGDIARAVTQRPWKAPSDPRLRQRAKVALLAATRELYETAVHASSRIATGLNDRGRIEAPVPRTTFEDVPTDSYVMAMSAAYRMDAPPGLAATPGSSSGVFDEKEGRGGGPNRCKRTEGSRDMETRNQMRPGRAKHATKQRRSDQPSRSRHGTVKSRC